MSTRARRSLFLFTFLPLLLADETMDISSSSALKSLSRQHTGAFAYAAAGVIFEANHASSCQSKKFPTAPVCSTLEAGPTVANDTVRVALNTGAFAAPRPTLS